MTSQTGLAQAKEDAQNEFQKLVGETVKRMNDGINWKEYALNRPVLESIVEEARRWFEETSRRADADAATFRARLAELREQLDTEMARFHAERERQLEEERRRAEREAMLKKWHALRERLAVLTEHITAEEFAFLKQHEREV